MKSTPISPAGQSTRARRLGVWIAAIAGGVLLLLLLFVFLTWNSMRMRAARIPSELDYATTQLTENGLYRVSYTAPGGAPPLNRIHSWTLNVATPDGRPVEDATITVDGDMPEHGHGLPTRPQVTQYLGNGDYLVEGLRFQMGGWWIVTFTITAGGQTDQVTFNLMFQR
jgi:hypothetical protein